MSAYTLELGEYLWRLKCECCGETKKRIFGFVSRDGDAHAVYYALLNVTEEKPRVGLTVSVGPWWGDTNPSERKWIHAEVWPDEDGIHMSVREPQQSNFYPWPKGGVAMDAEEAKKSDAMQEIWAVADFIVEEDPAISSYLRSAELDERGREERDADGASHKC
jgi:hypothetical protein